jgi:hypothetical protein
MFEHKVQPMAGKEISKKAVVAAGASHSRTEREGDRYTHQQALHNILTTAMVVQANVER